MEYQFTLFDQWVTKMSYGHDYLPELKDWDKQLSNAKQKIVQHFNIITDEIEDKTTLKLYVNHHYHCLLKLISDLYFVKDLYKELLLKSLEQIKFFFDLKFADLIVQRDDSRIITTLTVEEFAYIVNLLIECDIIKVRSKKALALNISKYIHFVGQGERNISTENFYNALFMNKPVTLNKAIKTLSKIQFQLNKALRLSI